MVPPNLLSLADASKLGLFTGPRPPTRQTVWNWATRGIQAGSKTERRIKLLTTKSRGHLFTTEDWVRTFLAAYQGVK